MLNDEQRTLLMEIEKRGADAGVLVLIVASLLAEARADERAELTAEVERLRANDGRYRFLCGDMPRIGWDVRYWHDAGWNSPLGENLDAALDAAIKEAGNG